jgi:hypothetical protein
MSMDKILNMLCQEFENADIHLSPRDPRILFCAIIGIFHTQNIDGDRIHSLETKLCN